MQKKSIAVTQILPGIHSSQEKNHIDSDLDVKWEPVRMKKNRRNVTSQLIGEQIPSNQITS